MNISVVIPAYNVENEVEAVLRSLPDIVTHIIVVDDASTDRTGEIVNAAAQGDGRITLLHHAENQGVGGALITGFIAAKELSSQIVVKMDGDGQMRTSDLPRILEPLIDGTADYTKGNRFRDFKALRNMPIVRLLGNAVLSFLVKAATGYWNIFDPTNGFIAIRGDVLTQLPLVKIHRSYFFEVSMLSQLYLIDATVKDVPIPTRYGNEQSHLSIRRTLFEFPGLLAMVLTRRLLLKKFIYNFSMESIYLVCGIPMLIAGSVFGIYNWIKYARLGVGAPTGTIMIAILLLILSFQMLLSAIHLDLQRVPETPINQGPLQLK